MLTNWNLSTFLKHERTIATFAKKIYDGRQTHEKILNITNHQSSGNLNPNEISPYTCQNGQNQKDKKSRVLVRMWRMGNPLALLVGMQTGAVTVENGMEAPQNIKNRNTIQSSNSTSEYLPKENKTAICTPCLLQHYL